MGTQKDFNAILLNAQKLLRENKWVEQYKTYAEVMTENLKFISDKKSNFNEWAPLYFYITTTKAKESKTKLTLDVRYKGQNVAILKCDDNDRVTLSTKGFDNKNLRHFKCDIQLDNEEWTKATAFRKFFRDIEFKKTHKKESSIESLLLTEFSKTGGSKLIRGIQPVKFGGKIRFAMPTPLSASDYDNLTFAPNALGGGIDILTRVGKSGSDVRLCIIEVKDTNETKEPPIAALQQAVEYTIFIRELLRSDAGPLWWKLFGFSGKIPAPGKLTLYSACAMPTLDPKPDDESFKEMHLDIDGDMIECHYIYFSLSDDENSFESIKTSLPG